ncbi:Ada metal-binding domain-containing protein [Ferrimonas gelatinilytica]|uniref:Ada metal-binding domain-containing protein n=1 Tax=Ferrimonas gelatinilytica TaxID=1255257 RepID=A0ABP9SGD5_9GAMM
MTKQYKLLSGSGELFLSDKPGVLGGNSKAKIYGKLDCSAANRALAKGYASHRVFFVSESDAINAGYRPCGSCMCEQYNEWKKHSNA